MFKNYEVVGSYMERDESTKKMVERRVYGEGIVKDCTQTLAYVMRQVPNLTRCTRIISLNFYSIGA